MEIGEGESFGVMSFRDRLRGAPAGAATVRGAFCMRIRRKRQLGVMLTSVGWLRGLTEAWADVGDLDVKSGEGGLARGRDVRMPGDCCTRAI